MTPSQFAALPEGEQAHVLGYEVYRQRQLAYLRDTLVGEGGKKSKLSAESLTALFIEGL